MKDRRQIGARHLARVRGAFRGGEGRVKQPVGHPADTEADGATRATGARTGGQTSRQTQAGQILGPAFPLFTAGGMVAQSL